MPFKIKKLRDPTVVEYMYVPNNPKWRTVYSSKSKYFKIEHGMKKV